MTPRSRGTNEIIGRSRREAVTISVEKHGRIGLEGKRGEEEKNCIEELCVCAVVVEGGSTKGRKEGAFLFIGECWNVSMRIIGSTTDYWDVADLDSSSLTRI